MIYPMFALILLTFIVAVYLFRLRVAAVKSGEVKLSTFRLNTAEDMPPKLLQAARNYSNLFEIPVLFYTASVLAVALNLQSPALIFLGWLFVATRVVHSWVHLTSNNVIRRMQAFMVGNLCILLMWVFVVWGHVNSQHL